MERLKLKDVLQTIYLINENINVIIRRAFDGIEYFVGKVKDVPQDFEYINRIVWDIYPFNKNGDLSKIDWQMVDTFDIGIKDFDVDDIVVNMQITFEVIGNDLVKKGIVPSDWEKGCLDYGQDHYEYWYCTFDYSTQKLNDMIIKYKDCGYDISASINLKRGE